MNGPIYSYLYVCPFCGLSCYRYSQDVEGYEEQCFTPPQHPHCHCSPNSEMALIEARKIT